MADNRGAEPVPPVPPVPPRVQPPVPARLSFGGVAGDYDLGRPSYPPEAVAWLVGRTRADVLELGAGTGKLTEQLRALGHRVLATDPLEPMLRRLVHRFGDVPAAVAAAERIPMRARSVDTVVGAQAFHWFDRSRALPEIARVLRPRGRLALAWNLRDERVPWVRRLGELIGAAPGEDVDPTHALLSSHLFGYVETATFRFWQPLDRPRLRALVTSRSGVATLAAHDREQLLARVDDLYDGYGRGADGMLLPYLTHCYRAVVRPPSAAADRDAARQRPGGPGGSGPGSADGPDEGDADSLLIDFR